jgi:hypothetical protein
MSDYAAEPAHPVAQRRDDYPLPDSLYPGSKDWRASDYPGRVEWLHQMYESTKRDRDGLVDAMARLAQPVAPAGLIPVEGAVWGLWNENGPSLIQRGTEDQRIAKGGGERLYRLAAAPQAPAGHRVALTDYDVWTDDAIMEVNAHCGLSMRWLMELVRAIEKKHGITQQEPAK